ncbi:OPT oligopeptide transporter protein-domain-containing protein [Mycena floridula]|nr:OPT oligopeptide transporter protein-domain-containing protein [Mycena floridula]
MDPKGIEENPDFDKTKTHSTAPDATSEKNIDEKTDFEKINDVESVDNSNSDFAVLEDERDIATHVITVHDDETLNAWTLRAVILGLALSAFGGVLAEIYYFAKTRLLFVQTVLVSTMFLAIIAYVMGMFFEIIIPTRGLFRYLNPHPFNKKENAFIVIMASAAANSALATENVTPNPAASIFLLFSSQLLGYGVAGLMRPVLLYPSKMLYPTVIPLVSMFDALFRDTQSAGRKLKIFWIVFGVIFFWEILPEWMFPLLTGFSVFCLANQKSPDFTRIAGGSNGNEGLGLLSICFDWQYISGGVNPMAIPLKAQFSNFIGYILCIVVFVAVYYKNIWKAQNFPFLAQTLFYENGTVYDQLRILNDKLEVDPVLLAQEGLPFYASTWVVQLLVTNLGMAATFTHLLLWNRQDMSAAWSWMTPSSIRNMWAKFNWKFWQSNGMRDQSSDESLDPHYREMLKYPDAPNSWYIVCLIASILMSMVIMYKTDSTLPWWGFLIALMLATISILFFGTLYAITGLGFIIQPFVQMIGGFIHPGKPMANMYFVLFSYNSVNQGQLLMRDLKIAQYTKLPPRCAFFAQISGTLFGAVLNFVLMNSIIDNQRPILLSVEGTNIWSGQQPQQFNETVAWGGLSHQLFAMNKRYTWVAWAYVVGLAVPVPFWLLYRKWPKLRTDYLYTPVIWQVSNSLAILRTYILTATISAGCVYPKWFVKYNYIVAAALDGGTQVMVFILSFAVQGASGDSHLFPQWWGANQNGQSTVKL